MVRKVRLLAAAVVLANLASPALAQKSGGILQMLDFASPASMSIHEESTITAGIPMMGVFNNLVMFDQHVPQNSLAVDRARSGDRVALERGRQGADLPAAPAASNGMTASRSPRPTSNAPGTGCAATDADKFRINPRKAWYRNLDEITTNGDYEVTFHLKRPQPYLVALLASGQSPVYPCHVSTAQMRQHPIGTGPFKFVEYKPNEHIRVTRNPDYWKPGRPYLDGIEYTIIANPATWHLAFVAGKLDFIFVDDPAAEGPEDPGAAGGLRRGDGQQQPRPADQPRGGAVRQAGIAAGDGALARPPGLHRHPATGRGRRPPEARD